MKRVFLIAALLVPVLLAAVWLGVRATVAMEVPPVLDDEAHAAAMAPLRTAVDGGLPARPAHPRLEAPLAGPAIVTVWSEGRRSQRVEGTGATAADALLDAARKLRPGGRQARIQVDLVVARGAFYAGNSLLRTFGVVPGLDGLGVELAGKSTAYLGADELVAEGLLSHGRLLPGMEFRAGLDFAGADASLARRAALPGDVYARSPRRYFRWRADSFVERPAPERATPPLPLVRGLPPAPPLTRESLRASAEMAARYLVDHLTPAGRFVYELDLATGKGSNPDNPRQYSLPRHAGTTYFMAQVYGATHAPWLRAPLDRAAALLVERAGGDGCSGTTAAGLPFLCVNEIGGTVANLGSTALAAVALAEYRLATGDGRHDEVHRRLLDFILDQQRANGEFTHNYFVKEKRQDLKTRLLYFDGEAALALVRGHKVFHDPRLIAAAERALDRQLEFYDFFAGQFFFNEEHWTCIAAEAAWPELRHDRYRKFCSDYGRFLRTMIFEPGEAPGQEDFAGAYGVTPFFVPHNTPAGSRSEAMISAYLLTVHHGRPDEELRRQDLAAVAYLLRQQVRAESDFATPAPHPIGAIPSSTVDRNVRIDFLQHCGSAILRAIELLPE